MKRQGFRYGLACRPASLGAIPPVLYTVEPPLADQQGQRFTRHGVFVTERPLSEKDIVAYELVVLADDDFKEELAITVALDLRDYAASYVAMADSEPEDFHAAVQSSLERARPYRVYVGDFMHFAKMVRGRLAPLADSKDH